MPTARLSLNITGHEIQYGAHAANVIAFAILSMRTVCAPSPARIPPPTFSAIRRGIAAILTVVVRGRSSCIRNAQTVPAITYPEAPSSHGHAMLTPASDARAIAGP